MSILVVGLSYRTAPTPVFERAAIATDDLRGTVRELLRAETVSEVLLLSTCNRVEVYAEAGRFHPAVAGITAVLAERAGLAVPDLADHLYVHFAEAAAEHMFSVAAGLDSMVLGEPQILGQLRTAYALGMELGSVGRFLHDLTRTALRVGKRVHTDTGIDRAGASVVSVALDRAEAVLGPLAGRRAVIVGAGSMGALAGATLRRRGVTDIVVVNRTAERARRLALSLGARTADPGALSGEISRADLLLSSTGASGFAVPSSAVRPRAGRPLVVLDLAVRRDVAPVVGARAGVTYVDLQTLRSTGPMASDDEVRAAAAIVAGELRRHLEQQRQRAVTPTVTALRARANQVIDAELRRIEARLPGLDDTSRREVAGAVRRAVEKVLHEPTVRVKEFASAPGGDHYAVALRELFALSPVIEASVAGARASA
jgi:glutamyl-tRNA reductase